MLYLVLSRHKYYNLFTNMLMYLSQQSEKIYLILKGKRKRKDQKQNCFPFYFCPLISSPLLCEVIKALEEEIICVKWWPKNDTKHTHTTPLCLVSWVTFDPFVSSLLVIHLHWLLTSPFSYVLSFFLSFLLSLFLTFFLSFYLSCLLLILFRSICIYI